MASEARLISNLLGISFLQMQRGPFSPNLHPPPFSLHPSLTFFEIPQLLPDNKIPYSSGIQSDMSNGSNENNNRGSHLGGHHNNEQYIMTGGDPSQWYGGSHNSGNSGMSTGSRNMSELDPRYQQLKNNGPPPLPTSQRGAPIGGGKGPLMNLGDMLPPPPEHPPPTDLESAAESTPPGSPRMEHPSRVLGGTIPANSAISRAGYPISGYQQQQQQLQQPPHMTRGGQPVGLLGFVPSPRTNPRSMTIPQQGDLNPGPTPPMRHYKLVPIPNANDSPNGSPAPQTVYLTQQSLPNNAPPPHPNSCCAQNSFENGHYGHCGGQCTSDPSIAQQHHQPQPSAYAAR